MDPEFVNNASMLASRYRAIMRTVNTIMTEFLGRMWNTAKTKTDEEFGVPAGTMAEFYRRFKAIYKMYHGSSKHEFIVALFYGLGPFIEKLSAGGADVDWAELNRKSEILQKIGFAHVLGTVLRDKLPDTSVKLASMLKFAGFLANAPDWLLKAVERRLPKDPEKAKALLTKVQMVLARIPIDANGNPVGFEGADGEDLNIEIFVETAEVLFPNRVHMFPREVLLDVRDAVRGTMERFNLSSMAGKPRGMVLKSLLAQVLSNVSGKERVARVIEDEGWSDVVKELTRDLLEPYLTLPEIVRTWKNRDLFAGIKSALSSVTGAEDDVETPKPACGGSGSRGKDGERGEDGEEAEAGEGENEEEEEEEEEEPQDLFEIIMHIFSGFTDGEFNLADLGVQASVPTAGAASGSA